MFMLVQPTPESSAAPVENRQMHVMGRRLSGLRRGPEPRKDARQLCHAAAGRAGLAAAQHLHRCGTAVPARI